MFANPRVILRVTKVSPRRGLSWLRVRKEPPEGGGRSLADVDVDADALGNVNEQVVSQGAVKVDVVRLENVGNVVVEHFAEVVVDPVKELISNVLSHRELLLGGELGIVDRLKRKHCAMNGWCDGLRP